MPVDFSNIDTVFNAALIEALRPGGYFPEGSYRPYSLDSKTTLNIPIQTTRVAGHYADVTNQLTPPNETLARVQLTADSPIKAQTWFGDSDVEDHGMAVIQQYANGVAMDIAEAEAHRMSAFLCKTGIDNSQWTSFNNEKASSESWDQYFTRGQHAIDLALRDLRKRHVKGPIYGLIHPDLFTAAAKSAWAGSADYVGNAMTGIPQRRMGVSGAMLLEETSIFDFDWGDPGDSTKPANLPEKYEEDYASYQILGVIWSAEALAIGRSSTPTVERDRHVDRSAWQYVARSRFGTQMCYSEGVQLIVADGGSGSAEGVFDV